MSACKKLSISTLLCDSENWKIRTSYGSREKNREAITKHSEKFFKRNLRVLKNK
jgi:hypothetical protein